MDEDGAFVVLRRAAKDDLRSCPDLEPQRYYLLRTAELGYSDKGARQSDGGYQEARPLAEEALRKFPHSARIATVAARLDSSVEAAQHAIALDENYGPAHTALAIALARNGNAFAAFAILAAHASNLSASALLARARIKMVVGDAHGAIADVLAARSGVDKEPEPTPRRDIVRDEEELLGVSLLAIGKAGESKKHLERAASMGSVKAREELMKSTSGESRDE
jgi:tetratricopeptide (TPR) repeat protein